VLNSQASPSTPRGAPFWDFVAVGLLLVAAWFLHGSAGYHRYSYYESLRNWVTLAWVAAAIRFYLWRLYPAIVPAVVIAVLFNPLSPITMRKWQWQPYDHWTMILSIAAAVALAVLAFKRSVQQSSSP
jgi:hypothetical protein